MLGEKFIFGEIEFSLESWLNLVSWLQWEEWRFQIKGEREPSPIAQLLGLEKGSAAGGFIIDMRTRDQKLLVEETPRVSVEVLLLLIPVPSEIDNHMSKNQYGVL